MRFLLQLIRVLTGLIFIFSGLVKLNDPLGTAYKLEEYFEVFALDFSPVFHGLVPYALSSALVIIVLEVVLGLAILLNYRMKITAWVLLSLVVFFTFLTFYSAFFNKVTDCGCFGDFLKISPWQSFGKDVFLLILIGALFFTRKEARPVVQGKFAHSIMAIGVTTSVYLGYFSLAHLPFFDFRPYSVNSSIPVNMKPEEAPEGAYVMKKGGKEYVFNSYPADASYEYVNYIVKNKEKSTPKITDYRIWNNEGDFTTESFQGNKLLIIVKDANKVQNSNSAAEGLKQISVLAKNLEEAKVTSWILTSSSIEDLEAINHGYLLGIPYFFADGTVLKTMIRSDPGVILISNGTVKGKWHFNDVPDASDIYKLLQ